MSESAHYFIRIPGKVSDATFSKIEKIAQEEELSLLGKYEVTNVPVRGGNSNLSLCDGMQMVFSGAAQDEFEQYVTENHSDIYVSRGSDLGILRISRYGMKSHQEMMRDFNQAVLSAVVATDLHNRSSEKRMALHSVEGSRFQREIVDIIREAQLLGIRNIENYAVFSGVPHDYPSRNSNIRLAEGTEIVLAGPYSGRVNEIKYEIPSAMIHVGFKLVA